MTDLSQPAPPDHVELWHEVKTLHEGQQEDFFAAELYHEASKMRSCDHGFYKRIEHFNRSVLGRNLVERAGKRYACAFRTPLPEGTPLRVSLANAILRRRSVRRFSGDPIPLADLATLLRMGNGFTTGTREDGLRGRTIPSGGALYPTEVYVLPLESELAQGAYHYDPWADELARFIDDPAEPVLGRACMTGLALPTASIALAITACFERQRVKYGERAYRFLLLECGHLVQNLLLVATALGLGSLPVGGFIDDPINEYLRLDPTEEAVLYVVLLGTVEARDRTLSAAAT